MNKMSVCSVVGDMAVIEIGRNMFIAPLMLKDRIVDNLKKEEIFLLIDKILKSLFEGSHCPEAGIIHLRLGEGTDTLSFYRAVVAAGFESLTQDEQDQMKSGLTRMIQMRKVDEAFLHKLSHSIVRSTAFLMGLVNALDTSLQNELNRHSEAEMLSGRSVKCSAFFAGVRFTIFATTWWIEPTTLMISSGANRKNHANALIRNQIEATLTIKRDPC